MKTSPSIVIKGLSKRYRGTEQYSLDDLSLVVNSGEVYGFLGPNGAGKSTTIRMLMNFIQPTKGSATILGLDIVRQSVEIKPSVGYLSGDFDVYPKMTGQQFIDYLSELQGDVSKQYATEIARRLEAVTDKKLGELSRGQRQKIGIIQAFMHKPDVLILDEPTSGLDPLMQEEFYKLVREAQARGAAIFVSSHIMSEVQKMCSRVGIIKNGVLVSEQDINELSFEASQTFDISFSKKAPTAELKKIKGLRLMNSNDNHVTIHMDGKLQDLFKVLAKYDVKSIDARTVDLEETFIHYYESGEQNADDN